MTFNILHESIHSYSVINNIVMLGQSTRMTYLCIYTGTCFDPKEGYWD